MREYRLSRHLSLIICLIAEINFDMNRDIMRCSSRALESRLPETLLSRIKLCHAGCPGNCKGYFKSTSIPHASASSGAAAWDEDSLDEPLQVTSSSRTLLKVPLSSPLLIQRTTLRDKPRPPRPRQQSQGGRWKAEGLVYDRIKTAGHWTDLKPLLPDPSPHPPSLTSSPPASSSHSDAPSLTPSQLMIMLRRLSELKPSRNKRASEISSSRSPPSPNQRVLSSPDQRVLSSTQDIDDDQEDYCEFVESLALSIHAQLPLFRPELIPTVLASFARLGYYSHPSFSSSWITDLLVALTPALDVHHDKSYSMPSSNGKGCGERPRPIVDAIAASQLLWSLGKIGSKRLPFSSREISPPPPSSSLSSGLPPSWVGASLLPAFAARLDEMNAQGISNSLWGLATLNIRPDAQLISQILMGAQETAQPLASPSSPSPSSHSSSSYPLPRSMSRASPQSLANTLWSLATLNIHPSPEWLRSYLDLCLGLLDRFGPQDLTQLAWALAKLGHPLPVEMRSALIRQSRACLLSTNPRSR